MSQLQDTYPLYLAGEARRMHAARALPDFSRAAAALPALIGLTKDDSILVRMAAAYACARLGTLPRDDAIGLIHTLGADATRLSGRERLLGPTTAASLVELLKMPGAQHDVNALVSHAGAGRRAEVVHLLNSGTSPNGLSSNSHASPLVMAMSEYDPARVAMVRLLIEAGADVNLKITPHQRTALHRAAVLPAGQAMVQLLLERGADPRVRNRDGRTAVDLADEYDLPVNAAILRERA